MPFVSVVNPLLSSTDCIIPVHARTVMVVDICWWTAYFVQCLHCIFNLLHFLCSEFFLTNFTLNCVFSYPQKYINKLAVNVTGKVRFLLQHFRNSVTQFGFRSLIPLVEREERHRACEKLSVGTLVAAIWLELCATQSLRLSSLPPPSSLAAVESIVIWHSGTTSWPALSWKLAVKMNVMVVQGRRHGVNWGGQVHPSFARGCYWDWCRSSEFFGGEAVGRRSGLKFVSASRLPQRLGLLSTPHF